MAQDGKQNPNRRPDVGLTPAASATVPPKAVVKAKLPAGPMSSVQSRHAAFVTARTAQLQSAPAKALPIKPAPPTPTSIKKK